MKVALRLNGNVQKGGVSLTICVCLRGLFFFIIAFGLVDLQTCSAQEEKPRARVREVGRVRSPRKYEQRDWRDLSTVVCVTQIQPPHGRTHIRFYAVAVSFFFFFTPARTAFSVPSVADVEGAGLWPRGAVGGWEHWGGDAPRRGAPQQAD